ncbi:hypothetical protein ACFY8C_06590 [Streptomyces flavochromogenes]|uniref:Uncharacterized protein n=1 Tax=Streptomyces flavochromogenes TaxID=68199 RepID=A0ABW6XKS4_9ACTN
MDHLAVANWMFQCVNTSEDDDQPDPPKPVPRPGASGEDGEKPGEGSEEETVEEVSPGQLARFFG